MERSDIPNHPGYKAGRDGSIWSQWGHGPNAAIHEGSLAILEGWRDKERGGRKVHTLKRSDGTFRRAYTAVFILEAFVGLKPSPELECCHNDGDCTNDSAGNLRWGTHKENAEDMVKHGKSIKGSAHAKAVLDEDAVARIKADSRPNGEVAIEHGVSPSTVHLIRKGKIWKHVAGKAAAIESGGECQQCGEKFSTGSGTGERNRRYCSKKCRGKAERARRKTNY